MIIYKNRTDLECYFLLQWGFHSLWILADLKPCWTTHATSTSTQRRVSQWVSGRSFAGSCFVHLSASVLENTTSTCIFGTGGSWVNRTTIYSFICTRPLKNLLYVSKQSCICLFYLIFLLSRCPSLCLIGIRSLPANGRRPLGETLSGTGRLWETAVLLLSISTAT